MVCLYGGSVSLLFAAAAPQYSPLWGVLWGVQPHCGAYGLTVALGPDERKGWNSEGSTIFRCCCCKGAPPQAHRKEDMQG